MNDVKDEVDKLLTFLEYDPNNLNIIKELVSLHIQDSSIDKALLLLDKGLAITPNDPALNAHLGYIQLANNQAAEAKESFIKAIEGGLTDQHIRFNYAYCLFLEGDQEHCLNELENNFESTDSTKEICVLRARCHHFLGDLEQAISSLNAYTKKSEFIETAEGEREVVGLLGLLYADADNPEEAMHYANISLTSPEHTLEALIARGTVLSEQREFDLAYEDFTTAANEYPAAGRAWHGLSQIEFHNFKFEEAKVAAERAVKNMQGNIGTWHILAWSQLMLNDIDGAKHSFESSLLLDKNFGETHGGLATCHALLGDENKAKRHKRLADKLAPNGFAAVYAQMILLNKSGKTEEAKQLLEKTKDAELEGAGVSPRALIEKRLNELKNKPKDEPLH